MNLYERAKQLIPGGTQLLSKRPELFLPDRWPAYYKSAKGTEVEALDGRRFVDVTLFGVGACPLGYADPDVEAAVVDAVRGGSMCTLNAPEEVALAERLVGLHPWSEQVRYARSGGEAMAIAVRIARAASGKDRVLFCGYHGWHDWYLAANLADDAALDGHLLPALEPGGVPKALAGSVVPFSDRASFDAAITKYDDVGVIVMEPARYAMPDDGYLEHVRDEAARVGAVLIFDEITAGFRMHVGGLHQRLGVAPDVAVFAKAMSNGYAMAAVIGRREVMEAVQSTFISSTYWTERIGPAAALATIDKLEREDGPARMAAAGDRMRAGWLAAAETAGLPIGTKGVAPLPSFTIEHDARAPLATLYTQWMLDEGYLASGAFYATCAHDDATIDRALEASAKCFTRMKEAIDEDKIEASLTGPVASAGLRKSR
ncbi:MAG: aminotransferase class III-fold pyridoxal phosphate-dependent enzyme [Deltaproteobacteria bacterium]|jgi:glutamate-1-semialdehyde 2,1-aminomutase